MQQHCREEHLRSTGARSTGRGVRARKRAVLPVRRPSNVLSPFARKMAMPSERHGCAARIPAARLQFVIGTFHRLRLHAPEAHSIDPIVLNKSTSRNEIAAFAKFDFRLDRGEKFIDIVNQASAKSHALRARPLQ